LHYLAWNDRSEELSRYLALTNAGNEHGQAVQQAFGVDAASFERAVREHADNKVMECAAITPATPLRVPKLQQRALTEAEAGLQVGELLLSTVGPSAQALELLQHAERAAPRTDARPSVALARAHYLKAIADKDAAALTQADRYLSRARAVAPDDPQLLVVEGHVLTTRASLSAEQDIEQARDALQRGRKAYRKAIHADDTLAEAYAALGASYLMEDSGSKEPVVVLETAAYLLPSYVEIPMWLAELHLRRGNPREAIAPLRYAMVHTDDPKLQEKAAAMLTKILSPGAL
jgi:tetratricopeptide (TPR) repeat protein